MFSGSTLLGSNLGNATMPGEGSVHQILEALHLQEMGQAREALQKPTTSQHKPQSRAMAGPCHLGQGDIPRRQCQSVEVLVPTLSLASPAGGGGLSCALLLLGAGGLPWSGAYQRLSLSGLSRLVQAKGFTVAGTSRAAAPSHRATASSYTPGTTRWISLDSWDRRTAKPARISVRTSRLRTNRHG